MLKTYVTEIAKWGKLRRWLSESDLDAGAEALWDVAADVQKLRGHNFSDPGVREQVIALHAALVERMRIHGTRKSQPSWASKILHWLLPGCAPVYDSLVLQQLGIAGIGSAAYRQIVDWEYACAQALLPHECEIIGEIREMTLLAAIDNYLWLTGKG